MLALLQWESITCVIVLKQYNISRKYKIFPSISSQSWLRAFWLTSMDTPLLKKNTIRHHLPAVCSLMQPFYLKQSLVFIIPGEYIWHLFTVQLLYQPILAKTLVENSEYETHQRSVCMKFRYISKLCTICQFVSPMTQVLAKNYVFFSARQINITTWLIFLITMKKILYKDAYC